MAQFGHQHGSAALWVGVPPRPRLGAFVFGGIIVSSNMSADTSTILFLVYDVFLYFSGQSTGRWSNFLLSFSMKRKWLHRTMRRPDLIELSKLQILSIYIHIVYQVNFNIIYMFVAQDVVADEEDEVRKKKTEVIALKPKTKDMGHYMGHQVSSIM